MRGTDLSASCSFARRARAGPPGACLIPSTAGMNRCFRMIAYAAHCFTRFIGLVAMPSRRERKDECRDAVQRYGRNTAEGQASPSTCAAMVRAWPRQRRNSPSARSQCRRDQGTRATVALQPSSAVCVRRLVGARFASFASLLLLFKSQPLRLCCDWRMTKGLLSRCGFVLTSQFHYRDR